MTGVTVVPEAPLVDSGSGLAPASEGWFVVNVRDARARGENWSVRYPVSELAARYGASAGEELTDPRQASVGFTFSRRERPSYWDRLPWACSD